MNEFTPDSDKVLHFSNKAQLKARSSSNGRTFLQAGLVVFYWAAFKQVTRVITCKTNELSPHLCRQAADFHNKCKSDLRLHKPVTTYFTLTHMKIVIGKVPATIRRDIRTRIQPKNPSPLELLSAETVKRVARGALESWLCSYSVSLGAEDDCFAN